MGPCPYKERNVEYPSIKETEQADKDDAKIDHQRRPNVGMQQLSMHYLHSDDAYIGCLAGGMHININN